MMHHQHLLLFLHSQGEEGNESEVEESIYREGGREGGTKSGGKV